ncbi:MAG: TetR/AcrR family transcriptional regulator [Sneathiella sp.]|nr:TetR/AcrR family transcriptional regulator [Sneathiella sp.]
MGNRDRILEAAKELFNTLGAANVGTNKIAAHLGISPGNLYYHFENREEIIRTIFPEISRETDKVFLHSDNASFTPALFGEILINWVGVVWKYRFFYGDLVSLLRKDPILKELYNQRRKLTLALMQKSISVYAENNTSHQRNFTEDETTKLAINIWIVALNWIGFLQVEKEDTQISHADLIAGAVQIFALMEPYLDETIIKNVHRQMAEKLKILALA